MRSIFASRENTPAWGKNKAHYNTSNLIFMETKLDYVEVTTETRSVAAVPGLQGQSGQELCSMLSGYSLGADSLLDHNVKDGSSPHTFCGNHGQD